MKNEEKPKQHFNLILAVLIPLLIVATISVCIAGSFRVSKLLFNERVTNLSMLMEKITQNISTVMQSHWDETDFCARQICETKEKTREGLYKQLINMERWLNSGENSIFIYDTDGMCYSPHGILFHWPNTSVLKKDEHSVYISSMEQIGKKTEQIFFVVRLPVEFTVENRTYTHIATVYDMSVLDDFFEISNYGDGSMTFVVRQNGTQVYHQKKADRLSRVFNIFEFLKNSTFAHETTAEMFASDIENFRSGCVSIEYKDELYFAIYHKMEFYDWYALLLAPEKEVGINSVRFMGSVILYIVIIAIFVILLLTVIILVSNRGIRHAQEVANSSLRRAFEAEHNASVAKTRFLSSMSHDIRTPMNAIIGMTTIALKHLDDINHVKECLLKISLSGNHLLTLINDILDISKIESGRMTLTPVVFSLADMANNIVNIVRPQLRSKKLQFDVRIHKIEHEYLFADELRLNQIFINILSNAVKYTPDNGKIMLDLKEQPVPNDDKSIRLTYIVQDSGIGMSEEFQKTMYDAFTRSKEVTVGRIQGVGLGLAITKQMVDLMGGTIKCESAPGKGTKFTVTLELSIAEKSIDEFKLPAISALVVDDDDAFLESSKDTLESMGMIIDTVDNGHDAVKMVVDRHNLGDDYKIVIIDWKMPVLNGLETTRAIRQAIPGDIPIVLISSYDWIEIESEAKEIGANGFITKPFFRSNVYYSLVKILGIEDGVVPDNEDDASDLKGLNVLVAEDVDFNWDVISEMLDMYEITSERAENGEECLKKLFEAPKGKYNLVLMDVQMPIMDGKTATKEIRAHPLKRINNIPIIAMTADAFAEDISDCFACGMDGHVAKPVDMDKLFQEIRTVFSEKNIVI